MTGHTGCEPLRGRLMVSVYAVSVCSHVTHVPISVSPSHMTWDIHQLCLSLYFFFTHTSTYTLILKFRLIHLGGPVCLAAVWGLDQRLDWQNTHTTGGSQGCVLVCMCVRERWGTWVYALTYVCIFRVWALLSLWGIFQTSHSLPLF